MRDMRELESAIAETPFLDLRLEKDLPVPAIWRDCERWQPRWTILFSLLAALLLWAGMAALVF